MENCFENYGKFFRLFLKKKTQFRAKAVFNIKGEQYSDCTDLCSRSFELCHEHFFNTSCVVQLTTCITVAGHRSNASTYSAKSVAVLIRYSATGQFFEYS